MLKVFRPLQVGFNSRVLEQDRKFHFIVSATLGISLETGVAKLETDFLKDYFEAMGTSLPDTGMPKPRGEFLLCGKCFSPGKKPVRACPVTARVGALQKTIYVFGDRFWKSGAGMTDPELFTEMPITYDLAFGGDGFAPNPAGKGLAPAKDSPGARPLPNLEDPNKLIGLPQDRPAPAGFAPLDPICPQRARFQGTYDDNYKTRYFPGYPADHDWHYFLCGAEDQWAGGFFRGDEDFALTNLHPDRPLVEGKLPALYPRCFILRDRKDLPAEFIELSLNLDTIWFFPEKLLAVLIFRKGIEVEDDEGEKITHAILGYEERARPPRATDHYRRALDLRLQNQDPMMVLFNTQDLIPEGHKCAMEIFQEQALGNAPQSEFAKNLDAKIDSVKKMVDEKVEDAIKQTEQNLGQADLPDEVKAQMPQLDLRELMKPKSASPSPEVKALNDKLESILPGITAGDPSKIDLKQFSFSKIDEVMAAITAFTDGKEKEAKDLARAEVEKAKDQVKEKLAEMQDLPPEARASMEESLKQLEAVDLDAPRVSPLPRLDAEEIIGQLDSMNPQVFEAVQHLQALEQAGVRDERTSGLEREIREAMENNSRQAAEALRQAEKDFKGIYLTTAQFLADGTSPHHEPVEKVTDQFRNAVAEGRPVADGDWACVDASGLKLDGLDLSGAYLEQVNFRGASLKGAKLCGAILVRSDLADADFSGADLTDANLGGVKADRTIFREANLRAAKLSRGNFAGADFSRAELEGVETLNVKIDGAVFSQAHLPGLQFLEAVIAGAKFDGADLSGNVFLKCSFRDVDFSGASLARSLFADMSMDKVSFDRSEMPGACFASTDPKSARMDGLSFRGAVLKQSNFQGLPLRGADFSDANLENCNFGEADLSLADLRRIFAPGAIFRKARLEGARLDGANLMNALLAKAYLVDASLAGANLFNVDFLRATVVRTDFRYSNLDNTLLKDWRPS